MYDLLDRPVAGLPSFERAVLLRMRRWVHALTLAGQVPAADDASSFDAAMTILERSSRDELVLERPCHAIVGETEAVLLGLWRLARAERVAQAHTLATALVGEDAARPMVIAMMAGAEMLG